MMFLGRKAYNIHIIQISEIPSHQLIITQPAAAWTGWHSIYLLCSVFFAGASISTYFNFWPLSIFNRYRTDLLKNSYLPPREARINKLTSFLAFGFASLAFFSVWFFSVSQGYRVTLDQDKNLVTRESIFLGDLLVTDTLPLERVKNADLQFGRGGARRLVLNEKSFEILIPLTTTFSDEEGVEAAAVRINQFIRYSPH